MNQSVEKKYLFYLPTHLVWPHCYVLPAPQSFALKTFPVNRGNQTNPSISRSLNFGLDQHQWTNIKENLWPAKGWHRWYSRRWSCLEESWASAGMNSAARRISAWPDLLPPKRWHYRRLNSSETNLYFIKLLIKWLTLYVDKKCSINFTWPQGPRMGLLHR